MKRILTIAIALIALTSCEKWCDCETVGPVDEFTAHNQAIHQMMLDSIGSMSEVNAIGITQIDGDFTHNGLIAVVGNICLSEVFFPDAEIIDMLVAPEEDGLVIDYYRLQFSQTGFGEVDCTVIANIMIPYEYIDSVHTMWSYFSGDPNTEVLRHEIGNDWVEGWRPDSEVLMLFMNDNPNEVAQVAKEVHVGEFD